MGGSPPYAKVGIAGSGTIACGLAAVATSCSPVVLLARSPESAERAESATKELCGTVDGADASALTITTEIEDLAGCELIVEAIVEQEADKSALLGELGRAQPEAHLATTTSSLSVSGLAQDSAQNDLFGLHVFNPVDKMKLVELCFPFEGQDEVRARSTAWCESLGKVPVEVPDQAGFVVNRLLFPYLFDAVRLLERTGMKPEDVDACMKLGGGHPMGPLELLDMVGIDVAVAIGEALHADSGDPAHEPPGLLVEMVGEGKLGRKSGAGFYES
jgi:3-hydroxybutyryl-CoA dehydrogenase